MSAVKVVYEWEFRRLDDGDIVELNHADTLKDAVIEADEELALVRDVWMGDDLLDRCWAEVTADGLPSEFCDESGGSAGVSVPKRFHEELNRWRKRLERTNARS